MKSLRWGVLSSARIAQQRFIPALGTVPGMELRAISSTRDDYATLADRLGASAAYRSHDDLLADTAVDAIYTPLPNALHAKWILRAIDAGKHVLCEKPMVGDVDALTAVIDASRARGVLIMEAFMYRHHPQYKLVRDMLREGQIGEIVEVHGDFHFAIDRSRSDIRFDPNLDGGSLNDIGCYPVDALTMLLGRRPSRVHAIALQSGAAVDTSLSAVLDFDGTIGTISCGFDGPWKNRLEIIGRDGQIVLDKAFDPRPDEIATVTISTRTARTQVVTYQTDQFADGIRSFAKAFERGISGAENEQLLHDSLLTRLAIHASAQENTSALVVK